MEAVGKHDISVESETEIELPNLDAVVLQVGATIRSLVYAFGGFGTSQLMHDRSHTGHSGGTRVVPLLSPGLASFSLPLFPWTLNSRIMHVFASISPAL